MGGWRLHWLTRPVPQDPEPGESSNAMTGACLTVSQVLSIPCSAAPSSVALLLVTSAFVTPIVTRGIAAKPCAIRAAAVVEAPLSFLEKETGARFGQADRLLLDSEVRCTWHTRAISLESIHHWNVTGRAPDANRFWRNLRGERRNLSLLALATAGSRRNAKTKKPAKRRVFRELQRC